MPHRLLLAVLLSGCLFAGAHPGAAAVPAIHMPTPGTHPVLACTPVELKRLRQALAGEAADSAPVRNLLKQAEAFLADPVVFPPRGAQHNQWLQCDACQLGLVQGEDGKLRCPRCGRVYAGSPYEDVLFNKQHQKLLRSMRLCAWAWALTDRRDYADRARDILLGYAERYLKYPFHDNALRTGSKASKSGGHLFEQTLDEATALAADIAPALDLVDSTLSDAERRTIRDRLVLPMLETIEKNKAGKSNWQSWHNVAIFAGGLMIGDSNRVAQSVYDPENGFLFQMQASVTTDGMWFENSWGYHFYTLRALTLQAEYARRIGLNLWSSIPLQRMFYLPVQYLMPGERLPRLGDDTGKAFPRSGYGEMLESLVAAEGAAGLTGYLPNQPTWDSLLLGRIPTAEPPPEAPQTSVVFRTAGHAILRQGGTNGLAAVLSFGPYGGFHGHFDKLSFVFYGLGEELGCDAGMALSQAYRLPIHAGWYKATLGHNAVTVDGQSQKPATGRLLLFQTSPNRVLAAAACDSAYDGVRQSRLLCLRPSYLLVVDSLASDHPVEFGWIYHNRGTGVRCALPMKTAEGPDYVTDTQAGTARGDIRAVFDGPRVNTALIMADAGPSDVLTGMGPLESVTQRAPMIRISRKGTRAVFCAVLEPFAKPGAPTITGVVCRSDKGLIQITVNTPTGPDVLVWDGEGKISAKGR